MVTYRYVDEFGELPDYIDFIFMSWPLLENTRKSSES